MHGWHFRVDDLFFSFFFLFSWFPYRTFNFSNQPSIWFSLEFVHVLLIIIFYLKYSQNWNFSSILSFFSFFFIYQMWSPLISLLFFFLSFSWFFFIFKFHPLLYYFILFLYQIWLLFFLLLFFYFFSYDSGFVFWRLT